MLIMFTFMRSYIAHICKVCFDFSDRKSIASKSTFNVHICNNNYRLHIGSKRRLLMGTTGRKLETTEN